MSVGDKVAGHQRVEKIVNAACKRGEGKQSIPSMFSRQAHV